MIKQKVCVLMTTYNPKAFLKEQIESVLQQKDVDVEIVIRDDASNNKENLVAYRNHPKITILEGETNLGVANNIKSLLEYARDNKSEYCYFAYSDQDDVWMEDKLSCAINKLKEMDNERNCLYYSNLLVTNELLVPSHELFKRKIVNNTLGQALSQVFLFACTSVFNRKMLVELTKYEFDKLGFDSLLYYLGILSQQIYFDDVPHIFYRQHGDNVSGQKEKGGKYVFNRIRSIIQKKERVFRYNAEFILKNMDNMLYETQRGMISQVATYETILERIKIIMNRNIRAGYMPKDLFNFVRLIMNRY